MRTHIPSKTWLYVILSLSIGYYNSIVHASTPIRVWVDTDASCGVSPWKDVDDCFALVTLLRSAKVEIVGISAVFGNTTQPQALNLTRELISRFSYYLIPLYAGANTPNAATSDATDAIIDALTIQPLTIIALGPLTNVANAIKAHPDAAKNIDEIIAVAGTRKPSPYFRLKTFVPWAVPDFNFIQDPSSFQYILSKRVPLKLAPFELAEEVMFKRKHLTILEKSDRDLAWLAKRSRPWLRRWQYLLLQPGFPLFDSMAVISLLYPTHVNCHFVSIEIVYLPNCKHIKACRRKKTPVLLATDLNSNQTSHIKYCASTIKNYEDMLINTLMAPGPSVVQQKISCSRLDSI